MNENIKHRLFGVCVAFMLLGAFVGVASATTWYVEEDPQINEEGFFFTCSRILMFQ